MHTWVSLRQASSRRHHHILSLCVSMRVCVCVSEELHFSRCSLIPVCFSLQPRGNQQATHGWTHRFQKKKKKNARERKSEKGRGGREKEKPPPHTHTHSLSLSLSLSLKGKQSLYSQGCAVKCLSFLPIQHLLPMTLPPSPLHLEEGRRGKTILAMNKVGDLLND